MIGMLMLGKMSTGIRRAASVPNNRMSNAATMNVYGRLRAILTIASIRPARLFGPLFGTVSALFQLNFKRSDLDMDVRRRMGTMRK